MHQRHIDGERCVYGKSVYGGESPRDQFYAEQKFGMRG